MSNAPSAPASLLWLALAACGADANTPDGGIAAGDAGFADDARPQLVEGAALPALTIALGAGTGPIVGVEDGLITRRDGQAWWVGTATETALGPIGRLSGGVALGGATALVLAEDGARVWTGTRLLDSAVADALGGANPRRAVRADDGALWFATANSLYVYALGEGRSVSPSGLPTTQAELAFGAAIAGRRLTWVASTGRVYAVDATRASLEPDAPSNVESIAVDGTGVLWARAAGALWGRSADGVWRAEGVPVREVGAAWITRATGLARIEDGQIRAVEGLDADAELLASDDGRAIVRSAGGLVEVRPHVRVAIVGLREGAVLTTSTAIAAYGMGPLTLTLDDAPLAARPFRSGVRATLPAATLTPGTHVLVARAGPDEARVSFTSLTGGVPTWALDIEPFFQDRCATCHRTGGNAHDLAGREQWRLEIDRILAAVRERRMPLPPYPTLDARELALIDGWKSAGFPE